MISSFKLCTLLKNRLKSRGGEFKALKSSERLLYLLRSSNKFNPYSFISNSASIISPLLRMKKKKVSGVIHNIPIPLSSVVSLNTGLRWLVASTSNSKSVKPTFPSESSLSRKLYEELLLSNESKGGSVKKKLDFYKLVTSNRPNLKFLK